MLRSERIVHKILLESKSFRAFVMTKNKFGADHVYYYIKNVCTERKEKRR